MDLEGFAERAAALQEAYAAHRREWARATGRPYARDEAASDDVWESPPKLE